MAKNETTYEIGDVVWFQIHPDKYDESGIISFEGSYGIGCIKGIHIVHNQPVKYDLVVMDSEKSFENDHVLSGFTDNMLQLFSSDDGNMETNLGKN